MLTPPKIAARMVPTTRFTLLEALRTRLPWLFGALLALTLIGAWFLHELAITESARIEAGVYAATIRLAGVFVLGLHVIASMTREFQDKGLELALSFDVRRGDYLLGRLSGFLIVACIIAGVAALPLFFIAPAFGELAGEPAFWAVIQWAISLAFELALIAATALFAVVTFTQLIPAASFTFAFYALARTLDAIRLMSDTPLAGRGLTHQITDAGINALAFVLPALDRFTQSAWLVDSAPTWSALAALVLQAGVYIALLTAAAMFDFYRRNF